MEQDTTVPFRDLTFGTTAAARRAAQREARFERLPKWAQQEIEQLRRDLAAAHAALKAGPEDSNTFADPYLHPRPLGTDPTISFVLGERNAIRVRIDRGHDGRPYLDVNASSGRLSIRPRSGNAVDIFGEDV